MPNVRFAVCAAVSRLVRKNQIRYCVALDGCMLPTFRTPPTKREERRRELTHIARKTGHEREEIFVFNVRIEMA